MPVSLKNAIMRKENRFIQIPRWLARYKKAKYKAINILRLMRDADWKDFQPKSCTKPYSIKTPRWQSKAYEYFPWTSKHAPRRK
ncbi:predicted protein [Histoplasma mississippiense (nom. inval.)]|uniref:predicted protein n=1 Tax=Ajellomyces capsulatus (strain NAm1 / WU24) TaxID=2059318 RepID=UPI000157C385|nr:predicted protein [Histoplasma mississippiense (nom. inval.)]EDN07697.1 predicted protein [Histoplasma mississippiense (nom. inval.)]